MSIERLTTISSHVIVGGGHFVQQGGQLVQQGTQNINRVLNAFDRTVGIFKSHAEKSAEMQRYAQEQFERSKEGLIDIGLALGNGAAGNFDEALQNALEAANKAAEIFYEQVKFAWPN